MNYGLLFCAFGFCLDPEFQRSFPINLWILVGWKWTCYSILYIRRMVYNMYILLIFVIYYWFRVGFSIHTLCVNIDAFLKGHRNGISNEESCEQKQIMHVFLKF